MTKTVVMPPKGTKSVPPGPQQTRRLAKGSVDRSEILSPEEARRVREALLAKTPDPHSKMRRAPPGLTGTVVISGAPKKPDAAKSEPPKKTQTEAPPGGVLSPFDAPAPERNVFGAEAKADGKTEPRAATPAGKHAGLVEKTQVLSPQTGRKAPSGYAGLTRTVVLAGAPKRPDAAEAPAQAQAKGGGSGRTQPPPVVRPSKRPDAPSKMRRPSSPKALTRTVVIPGGPQRAKPPVPAPAPAPLKPPVPGAPGGPGMVKPLTPLRREETFEPPAADAKPTVVAPVAAPTAEAADVPAAKPLMQGAKLRGTRLVRADLRGADLRRADLTNADLGHADLSHAQLGDADLSYANLFKTKLEGAEMDGCKRAGTRKVNPDRV